MLSDIEIVEEQLGSLSREVQQLKHYIRTCEHALGLEKGNASAIAVVEGFIPLNMAQLAELSCVGVLSLDSTIVFSEKVRYPAKHFATIHAKLQIPSFHEATLARLGYTMCPVFLERASILSAHNPLGVKL